MQGNYPEESIQHSEHGESLKSRIQTKSRPVGLYKEMERYPQNLGRVQRQTKEEMVANFRLADHDSLAAQLRKIGIHELSECIICQTHHGQGTSATLP
jgi:hypothetical protein